MHRVAGPASSAEERARIKLDGLADTTPSPIDPEALRRVSREAGFVSREPGVERAGEGRTEPLRTRRSRRPTGRTHPFNTRLKPETYELICQLSDDLSAAEDRPVSMAEVLERALAALTRERSIPER